MNLNWYFLFATVLLNCKNPNTLNSICIATATASSPVTGVVNGSELSLEPSGFYSCPNESVTFRCSDSQVTVMEWKVEPYTNRDGDLSYIPLILMDDPGPLTMNSSENTFSSKLLHFSRIDHRFANMTTSLTVKTSGIRNGTNITCTTLVIQEEHVMNATIYFAG